VNGAEKNPESIWNLIDNKKNAPFVGFKLSINSWFTSLNWYGGVLPDSIDRDQSIIPPIDGKQRFVDFILTQVIDLVKK